MARHVHTHAEHRPVRDQSQAGAERHPLREFYPLDDVVAVLPDEPAAASAKAALVQDGLPDDDIDLVDGGWFIEHTREVHEHRTLMQRLAGLLTSGEERAYVNQYQREASDGHPVLFVHAADHATADHVRRILSRYGARHMRHYRSNVIEDLIPAQS